MLEEAARRAFSKRDRSRNQTKKKGGPGPPFPSRPPLPWDLAAPAGACPAGEIVWTVKRLRRRPAGCQRRSRSNANASTPGAERAPAHGAGTRPAPSCYRSASARPACPDRGHSRGAHCAMARQGEQNETPVQSRAVRAIGTSAAATRLAPERADIEPGAIRQVLGDTFVLEVDGRASHPFRIAGTRLCALFGRELKGESFIKLWQRSGPDRAARTDRRGDGGEGRRGRQRHRLDRRRHAAAGRPRIAAAAAGLRNRAPTPACWARWRRWPRPIGSAPRRSGR